MLQKITQYRVVRIGQAVMQRFSDDGGNNMAAAVAYYGFLSLFPLLLLALALIGFVLAGDVQAQREWVERLSQAVPGIGQLIGKSIRVVVDGRGAVGLIALAGLAWTGAGIVNAAGTALNRILRVPGYGNFLRQKAWQFGTLAVLGTLALLALVVTGSVAAIERSGPLGLVLRIAPALLGLGLDFALFMLSYRLLTQRRGPRFGKLWVGATFGAIGWTILKLAGGWYAERVVSGATAVYGTFAAVVGVLALLHLSARLLLYGAEINAVLIEEKGGGPMSERDPTEGRYEAAGNGEQAPQVRSTPDLIMSIAGDTSALVRKEMELARQEMVESVTSRLKTVGSLAVAGVLGLFALGWLASALASALDGVLVPWASRLIVAGIFLLLAEAEQDLRESLALCRQLGDRTLVAYTVSELATILLLRGNLTEARELVEDPSLPVGPDAPHDRTVVLWARAMIALVQSDQEAARNLALEALEIERNYGDTISKDLLTWWAGAFFGPEAAGGDEAIAEARERLEQLGYRRAFVEADQVRSALVGVG